MSFNTQGRYAQQVSKQFQTEVTGIWAAPQNLDIDASFNGAERTLTFNVLNAAQNAASFISGVLPDSSLFPSVEFKALIAIFDNNVVSSAPGVITISVDGSFTISPLGGLYSGTNNGGFPTFYIKYVTSIS